MEWVIYFNIKPFMHTLTNIYSYTSMAGNYNNLDQQSKFTPYRVNVSLPKTNRCNTKYLHLISSLYKNHRIDNNNFT